MAEETLEGTLERFVYRDAGSPFVVARLSPAGGGDVVSIVGTLGGVEIGTSLRLHGSWETDRRYGRQFRIRSYQAITPATLAGIERYLGSGMIQGLGPELAKRIVARFGERTLEIIHDHPERLTEVEGIGKVRAERIRAKWQEQREVEDVMVFLQGHGVSPAFAWRIYKRYGAAAVALVRENPYRLALEVWGIGFKSADALAQRLGIEPTSPARAEAGLLHVLGELTEDGHVHAPEHELLKAAGEALSLGEDLLAPAVERLVAAGRFVRETLGDRGECLSLRALWEAETRAADGLRRLLGAAREPVPVPEIDAALARFEREHGFTLAAEQRAAVRAAVSDRVTVITGGPGVGKTTIVNAVIRILEARRRRVILGAPTGRAAKRLAETTGREAMTLHRLLEFSPKTGAFARGEKLPLAADAVIVDEASMLDVHLAAHLFSAVPPHAQLVLVGDIDQLPSVGPGRVLGDVITSRAVTVVRLTEIFRQAAASFIVTNAHRVNRGQMPELATHEGSDFYFIEREEPESALATILEVVAERIPRRFGLAASDVQVLSPMHRGDVGAQRLNAELQARLNPPRGGAEIVSGKRAYRAGDRVIQNRNDYDKDVFNGDVGRIVEILDGEEGRGLVVDFDGRRVPYDGRELEQLGHAFALTVHKSQGSEYVAVVMPVVTQHYLMLQRNLLYTGMTRGKKLVVLVGSKRALGIAVRNDETRLRWTWLAERIRSSTALRSPR
jgi:exodeoxyribonuclease V alpha subunit